MVRILGSPLFSNHPLEDAMYPCSPFLPNLMPVMEDRIPCRRLGMYSRPLFLQAHWRRMAIPRVLFLLLISMVLNII